MQTITQKNCFVFMGTIHELRYWLRNLPKEMTVKEFIEQQLH